MLWVGMHILPFRLKRAWQSTLSHLRRLAKPFGLTPARYDLLHLLTSRYMLQSAIHKALGVTKSTTSRMLISLEKLGFIYRNRTYCTRKRRRHLNRRNYVVNLTDEGRRRLRAVRVSVIAPWIVLAFECFFLAQGSGPIRAFWQVDKLTHRLLGIAQHFGDKSHHNYRMERDPEPDPDLLDFVFDWYEDADPGDIIPLEDQEPVVA